MSKPKQMKIHEYDPKASGYGPRLTAEEWERFRPILTAYHHQGLTRHEVLSKAAAEHGFRGTYAALNTRFKVWGLTNGSLTVATEQRLHDRDSGQESSTSGLQAPATSTTSLEPDDWTIEAYKLGQHSSTMSTKTALQNVVTEASSPALVQRIPDPIKQDDMEEGGIQQPSYIEALAQAHKRSRSECSSIISWKFSMSSTSQSFVHTAKRLRLKPARISVTSLLSQLSIASSHRSQSFANVTGLSPSLEAVVEDQLYISDYQLRAQRQLALLDKSASADKKLWRSGDRPFQTWQYDHFKAVSQHLWRMLMDHNIKCSIDEQEFHRPRPT